MDVVGSTSFSPRDNHCRVFIKNCYSSNKQSEEAARKGFSRPARPDRGLPPPDGDRDQVHNPRLTVRAFSQPSRAVGGALRRILGGNLGSGWWSRPSRCVQRLGSCPPTGGPGQRALQRQTLRREHRPAFRPICSALRWTLGKNPGLRMRRTPLRRAPVPWPLPSAWWPGIACTTTAVTPPGANARHQSACGPGSCVRPSRPYPVMQHPPRSPPQGVRGGRTRIVAEGLAEACARVPTGCLSLRFS